MTLQIWFISIYLDIYDYLCRLFLTSNLMDASNLFFVKSFLIISNNATAGL